MTGEEAPSPPQGLALWRRAAGVSLLPLRQGLGCPLLPPSRPTPHSHLTLRESGCQVGRSQPQQGLLLPPPTSTRPAPPLPLPPPLLLKEAAIRAPSSPLAARLLPLLTAGRHPSSSPWSPRNQDYQVHDLVEPRACILCQMAPRSFHTLCTRSTADVFHTFRTLHAVCCPLKLLIWNASAVRPLKLLMYSISVASEGNTHLPHLLQAAWHSLILLLMHSAPSTPCRRLCGVPYTCC